MKTSTRANLCHDSEALQETMAAVIKLVGQERVQETEQGISILNAVVVIKIEI